MADVPKNYLLSAFLLSLLVVVFLLLLRHLPETTLGEIEIRKADILTDIRKDPAPEKITASVPVPAEKKEIPAPLPSDTLREQHTSPAPEIPGLTPIEDYSEGESVLVPLVRALTGDTDRPARIAFLGDSFIEGDLLTADIREMLQDTFGGNGVGFVPVTSPVSRFRQTIVHDFEGWKTYSIKNHNESTINNWFVLSGTLFRPEGEEAEIRYKIVPARKHLSHVSRATFLFINRTQSRITVRINDTLVLTADPPASDEIQRLVCSGYGPIRHLSFRIAAQDGFYAYGTLLDGTEGIALDNFSDRGNSGLPLGSLAQETNEEFNRLVPYDLIVLQYGLNVISEKMYNYRGYADQMCRVIKRLQRCYPETGILVMGVSDRSRKTQDGYCTMAEIKSLVSSQRQMARECKIAFWDTFSAMGGENSMPRYVEKGWAAKDYTHISAAGGRVIAREFVKALLHALPRHTRFRPVSPAPEKQDSLYTGTL